MSFDDELAFEAEFVKALQANGWTDGILHCPTEEDLINNWAKILFDNNRQQDRLNDYPLTRTEMDQILEQISRLRTPVKLNNPDDVAHFGKEISLKIYDRKEIAARTKQIPNS